MVSLGADLCLAYPQGESKGTRGCATFAKDAGIPTFMTENDSIPKALCASGAAAGSHPGLTLFQRFREAGFLPGWFQ